MNGYKKYENSDIELYIYKKEQEKNSILDINPEFILSLTQAVRLPA